MPVKVKFGKAPNKRFEAEACPHSNNPMNGLVSNSANAFPRPLLARSLKLLIVMFVDPPNDSPVRRRWKCEHGCYFHFRKGKSKAETSSPYLLSAYD